MNEKIKKYYDKANNSLPVIKSQYDFDNIDKITTLMEDLGEETTQTYAILSTLSLAYYRQNKEKK